MNNQFILFAVALSFIGVLCACRRSKPDPETTEAKLSGTVPLTNKIEIFAQHGFYRERQEPEEIIVGTLEKVQPRVGPNTREMPFHLVLPNQKLSVYVTDREAALLEQFVGQTVKATGKRIDQTAEGFGWEIWIGSIEISENDQK